MKTRKVRKKKRFLNAMKIISENEIIILEDFVVRIRKTYGG